jgi:hypothetical protein
MKKLVWLAGLVLLASFAEPYVRGKYQQSTPAVVEDSSTDKTDPTIQKLLAAAQAADKADVRGIYKALRTVVIRDAGKRVVTTEQWSDLQSNTLQLVVTQVNKYPGLDEAIEQVFLTTLGTDDVLPGNEQTRSKIVEACDIIINSAK